MAVEITYTATCKNNALVIIDSLAKDESQTGRRLEEDVTDFANSLGLYSYCTRYAVEDRASLLELLKLIEINCTSGEFFPALHFECHGDPERGLWLAPSDEYVPWNELATLLTPINAATRNNLSVVLATCNGFQIWRAVNMKAPCPFHFLIAPNREISAGEIHDCILPFYKKIISGGSLNIAITRLDRRFQRFIAGEWFHSIYGVFLTYHYSSKDRAEMVEQMVSNQVEKSGYRSRALVRACRAKAKNYLANPQNLYQKISKHFFHGQAQISFTDMKAFVDDQKRLNKIG